MFRTVTAACAALLALAAPAALAQGQATLQIATGAPYGAYLVGPSGLPLYMFETDRRGAAGAAPGISCAGACLEAWPLVTVAGRFAIAPALDAALVGIVRHQGRMVVTYGGWPLYTYVQDTPGQPPQGQGVDSFGGRWYLLAPDGRVIAN